MARRRSGCGRKASVALPARRVGCRPRIAFDEPARMYVAGWEPDGRAVVDVVDGQGRLKAHWECGSEAALAVALLADATGHRPKEHTAAAFAREVLSALPREAFAITSQEVCAWLLVRAIERLER